MYLRIKTSKDKNHDGCLENVCLNYGIRNQSRPMELNGGKVCTRYCGWAFHRHLLAIVQEHWPCSAIELSQCNMRCFGLAICWASLSQEIKASSFLLMFTPQNEQLRT